MLSLAYIRILSLFWEISYQKWWMLLCSCAWVLDIGKVDLGDGSDAPPYLDFDAQPDDRAPEKSVLCLSCMWWRPWWLCDDEDDCHDQTPLLRDAPPPKKTGFFWNFSQRGEGGLLNSQNFRKLTKLFLVCQNNF